MLIAGGDERIISAFMNGTGSGRKEPLCSNFFQLTAKKERENGSEEDQEMKKVPCREKREREENSFFGGEWRMTKAFQRVSVASCAVEFIREGKMPVIRKSLGP